MLNHSDVAKEQPVLFKFLLLQELLQIVSDCFGYISIKGASHELLLREHSEHWGEISS